MAANFNIGHNCSIRRLFSCCIYLCTIPIGTKYSGIIWRRGGGELGHLPQSSIYINLKSAHLPHAPLPVNLYGTMLWESEWKKCWVGKAVKNCPSPIKTEITPLTRYYIHYTILYMIFIWVTWYKSALVRQWYILYYLIWLFLSVFHICTIIYIKD